jgi:hypothetical protein
MADKPARPVEAATAAPGEKRSAARPPLASAAGSGDPAVQKLLADRNTAAMNGDSDGQAQATAALAELGFE